VPNNYSGLLSHVAWVNLNELGMAIAPAAMRSARTTGIGGFRLGVEAAFAHANACAGGVP
jgi:hypothetical protein